MALVDLDTIELYQSPAAASLPCERVPRLSNANGSMVVARRESAKTSGLSDG